MKWLRNNVSILTLFGVIVSLCVYIYQDDRGKNKEEHGKMDVKIDKIIERLDTYQKDEWERYIETNTKLFNQGYTIKRIKK